MFTNCETVTIFLDISNGCDNFKVDDFMSSIKKCTDLKTALEDLKSYHKVLCQQINQHINKDYIDYIIVSANIIIISKYLKNFSVSLEKLKNAIFERKSDLDQKLMMVRDKMSQKNSIKKLKFRIKHILHVLIHVEKIKNLNIHSCLQNAFLNFLEKELLNLSMIQLYSDENILYKHSHQNMENTSGILKGIENKLERCLIHFIDEKDFYNLFKILYIYSMLNKRETENIVREKYVRFFMQKCITEGNILQCDIVKVYDCVLDFVSQFCTNIELLLQNMAKDSECFPDFDFIVNIIWIEILQELSCILPVHIFSPGDANKFHADYCATVAFLRQFELRFGKLTSIILMREQNIYKTFIEKWNLDVYFKIRFLEIAGRLERTLLYENKKKAFVKCGDSQYLLRSSKVLIECLNLCWDDSIFLQILSREFWKLTLQLISRYNVWALSHAKDNEMKNILFYQVIVSVIVDTEQLIKDFEKLFNSVISSKIEKLAIEVAFIDTLKTWKTITLRLEKSMLETLTKEFCSHVASVTDIPKFYLKTNRDIPAIPSPYVIAILNFLSDFFYATDSIITKELKKSVVNHITILFVKNWRDSVFSTIMSVKKIEESRKILKRAKNKPTVETKNDNLSVSDDEKIKIQFIIDANTIEEFLKSLGNENIESFKKVKELINYWREIKTK